MKLLRNYKTIAKLKDRVVLILGGSYHVFFMIEEKDTWKTRVLYCGVHVFLCATLLAHPF